MKTGRTHTPFIGQSLFFASLWIAAVSGIVSATLYGPRTHASGSLTERVDA
jgi:hypothetical protein